MFGTDMNTLYPDVNPKHSIDMKKNPCVYVNLPSDQVANQIQERSVLIKEVLNVLSESTDSYEDLIKNVDIDRLTDHIHPTNKFRFFIEGLAVKIPEKKSIEVIEMFKIFPFNEKLVDLNDYQEYFKVIKNEVDGKMYFGKMVAACRLHDRKNELFHTKFSLKKRPYLGPTSTDHELAFLMANMGQV
jgi:tRNA (guanine10-N2)-methyltransferase